MNWLRSRKRPAVRQLQPKFHVFVVRYDGERMWIECGPCGELYPYRKPVCPGRAKRETP